MKNMDEFYKQLDVAADALEAASGWSLVPDGLESKLQEWLSLVKSEAAYVKTLDVRNGLALEHIQYQTPGICMAAVQNYGNALRYVQKQTPEICMAAVGQFGYALQYAKVQTPELCLAAMQREGYALRYVKNQTPEICMAAVQNRGYALKYVKERTPELCLAAVQSNGLSLANVKNQTPEICLAAVQEDWNALEYVKEQTSELCLAAVKSNGLALKLVQQPNVEIFEAALKSLEGLQNSDHFYFDPVASEAAIEYYPLAQNMYFNALDQGISLSRQEDGQEHFPEQDRTVVPEGDPGNPEVKMAQQDAPKKKLSISQRLDDAKKECAERDAGLEPRQHTQNKERREER